MDRLSEYRREMKGLCFTPEQKAALAARVRAAAQERSHAARRPMRWVLAAASVAVIFATGYGAVAAGLVGNAFDSVFGTSQTEVINKIGRPIGAGATDNGITVTADAIIGDKYSACIVYTVRRKDGSPLRLPAGISIQNLSFEDFGGSDLHGGDGLHGSVGFLPSSTDKNAAQYVESISANGPLKLGKVNARFHNMQYFDPKSQRTVTFCKGDWNFSFRVKYEDSSVALKAGETFTRDGSTFKITKISVSPVALHMEYEAEGAYGSKEETSSSDGSEPDSVKKRSEHYLGLSVLLTKKDGSVLNLTDNGGSIDSSGGKTVCTKGGVFREIVPIEEMKSVSVQGVEIPVGSD